MSSMKSDLNILVVDDSRANLVVLSAMLADMGYKVVQAGSGEEALDLFRQRQPDMVMMDVVMPGMGGHEAVREMRCIAKEWLPIIFVTAAGQADDLVRSIEVGGDDYLLKPVNYKVLQAKINALFHRLKLSRQLDKQNRLLLDYQVRNEEEHQAAQEFMSRLLALDKIDDPWVHFHLQAAEIFSGDLIAAARTPANQLYAMLADSTGHGLTAALAVMPVLQSFHAMVAKGYSIGAVAAEINRKIREYLPSNRFVAAVLFALDTENSRVSIWNGGCPPAVLLNSDGMVAYQFDSMHLPLGILDPDKFDDEVVHYHYGNNRCQILLCSDGAVDSADPGSMELGMSHLLREARTENRAERLPGMVRMLERQLAGKAAHDDIALILVDCPPKMLEEDIPVPPKSAPRQIEIRPLNVVATREPLEQMAKVEWQFDLVLTAPQLRQTDIVPMLLHVVNQIEHEGIQEVSGKLFLVLSELFNNALDHGLLGLDSVLKNEPMGMDRYFEERAARLNNLEQGEIKIKLMKTFLAHGPCLKIAITDSGEGFDFLAAQADALEAGMHRYGRGIALVKSLSGQLHYSEHGNKSYVCLPLLSPEQCVAAIAEGRCKPGAL